MASFLGGAVSKCTKYKLFSPACAANIAGLIADLNKVANFASDMANHQCKAPKGDFFSPNTIYWNPTGSNRRLGDNVSFVDESVTEQPFHGNEDEGLWPANPWQAQADAHLLHLQRSLQEVAGPALILPCGVPTCGSAGFILAPPFEPSQPQSTSPFSHGDHSGLLRRVHDLEGQVASMEVAAAAQGRDLDEARAELEALRRKPVSKAADDTALCALQEKNDFLQVLVGRFERKVMTLEEENAGLTVALGKQQTSSASIGLQTEDGIIDELEGQVEMLAQQLRSKDFELQQVKDSLEAVPAQRGRTARELADVESLQSRTGFLSDLVNRFEDKTMALEKELKEMREDRAVDAARQKIVEDAAHQNAEALQQSKEEVESMKLLLRDTKKEHNKRVQDLLKQIQLARGRRTDTKSKEEQERLEQLRDELRELKDLNGRLVERLGHERAEHAEARQQLFRSERERGILEQRTENLSEQLIVLAEVNDSLEHLHEQETLPAGKAP
ncbi:unnamed protein product [Symbiodinium microadriaticum]|nr:unnamed protein product [Symbiodinium microadriaticum]